MEKTPALLTLIVPPPKKAPSNVGDAAPGG